MNLTPRHFWGLEWGYHIITELFCCFWRCNRNSGHRFLYTCLPKILGRLCSLSKLSVRCWWSQWGVIAARQSDSWWRWWSDVHCEWCSQCYDQTHFYHVHLVLPELMWQVTFTVLLLSFLCKLIDIGFHFDLGNTSAMKTIVDILCCWYYINGILLCCQQSSRNHSMQCFLSLGKFWILLPARLWSFGGRLGWCLMMSLQQQMHFVRCRVFLFMTSLWLVLLSHFSLNPLCVLDAVFFSLQFLFNQLFLE